MIAARVEWAIRAAGVDILGVSIGEDANKATWRVSPASLQAAAQPVIDAFDPEAPLSDGELAAAFQPTSRQKDVLATIAWTLSLHDPAAWEGLTVAQKKAATLAQANDWRDLRIWIEKNL